MSLVSYLYGIIFPTKDDLPTPERREWREAIHENRNVASRSQATARLSRKASDDAYRSAQSAIKLLERSHDDSKNEKNNK